MKESLLSRVFSSPRLDSRVRSANTTGPEKWLGYFLGPMGAMGSDAAIEAADIVLMDDDPMKISKAIRISRKCLRIVYQNIAFALVVKFACLILGAFGIANMYLAVFADVGVMILAVLNAIRCLFVKKL